MNGWHMLLTQVRGWTWANFLSLAWSKLRLCSANHRPGYWSNLPCDWPSTAWAYSEQETENRPWASLHDLMVSNPTCCHCSPERVQVDGLAQDCSNSIANALELLQSCAKSSKCTCLWSRTKTQHPKNQSTWKLKNIIHVLAWSPPVP